MQLVFRHVTDQEFTQPPDGELILRLRHKTATSGRAMAEYILKEGLAAFPKGTEPIERIVAPLDPTLDDMLAVEFAQRLLLGGKLPEGASSFARYAALAREGLKPGDVPLDSSLEGIFLAMRNNAGEDLSKPEAGAKFCADWPRLASRIMSAAEKSVDPFTQSFLSEGPEFARERSFLRHDHEVFRQDVERGQEWSVRILAGPPSALGLLLHQPKSLLFKYWSRDSQLGGKGKPYLFLAVDWGTRKWVFSTDPVQRLSLLGLHETLQGAETAVDAGRAKADPWFDGAPFGHTLVAAPKHGTVLADEHVLRLVRQWTGAKPVGTGTGGPALPFDAVVKVASLASALVALLTFYLVWVRPGPTPPVIEPKNKNTTPIVAKGDDISLASRDALQGNAETNGVQLMPGRDQTISLVSSNPTPLNQNVKMKMFLKAKDPADTANLKVQSFYVNKEDRARYADFEVREGMLQPKAEEQQSAGDKKSFATVFQGGNNKVNVVVSNGGMKPIDLQARLEWQVDRDHLPDLYVLAIGVGDSLPHSVDDAKALYDFFGRTDTGLLFKSVHRLPLLVNEQASKAAIFNAINELNSRVENNDIVLISISAHGTVVRDRYYLLPSGWEESDQSVAAMNSSAISRDDFLAALNELTEKCYVLVVLDTCHAAAVSVGGTTRDVESQDDMKRYFDAKQLVDRMQNNPKGIVVICASLGSKEANELERLKHGALTFALLEGLEGKLLFNDPRTDDSAKFLPPDAVVDLQSLSNYAVARVKKLTDILTNHPQSVVVMPSAGISLGDIPLLVRPGSAAGK